MNHTINRCVILIRPKKRYYEWGNNLEKTEEQHVEEGSFGNAYLLKELDSGTKEEVRKALKKHWRRIADEEFVSWWTVEDDWPQLKSIKDFELYFEWNFTEIVFDLENTDLIREEF